MNELNQSTYLNPAFISTYEQSYGIPGLSNTLAFQFTGFSLGNITDAISSQGFFNFTNFYNSINSGIGIKLFTQSDLFHISRQFGHYQIGLHMSVRSNTETYFSKDFVGFIAKGNDLYAGQDVSFSGTKIQSTTYIETGVSVAREFEKFTIGARFKLLNGITDITTNSLDVHYLTASNSFDQSTVTLSGSINSSGLPDPNHQDTVNGRVNTDTVFSPNNIKPLSNLGFAIDLGATYNVTPRLKIAASAIDLGFINWNNKTYNYNINNVTINFPGLNTLQLKDSAAKQQFVDSLKNLVKTNTNRNSYSTMLPSRFILSADYNLSLRDRVGALFQLQYFMNTFYPSFAFSYSRKIGTNWRITSNYAIYNNSFTNIGLGTSVKFGAFQFYVMQDDILFYFIPSTMRTLYLRFGCNLVWGERRTRVRI